MEVIGFLLMKCGRFARHRLFWFLETNGVML